MYEQLQMQKYTQVLSHPIPTTYPENQLKLIPFSSIGNNMTTKLALI